MNSSLLLHLLLLKITIFFFHGHHTFTITTTTTTTAFAYAYKFNSDLSLWKVDNVIVASYSKYIIPTVFGLLNGFCLCVG